MSNGDAAIEAIVRDCEAAIDDVRRLQPAACQAHEPMARLLIATARLQVACLHQWQRTGRRTWLWVGGIVLAAASGNADAVAGFLSRLLPQ